MPLFRGNPELLRAFRAGQRDALEQVYWATIKRIEQIVRHGFWVASSGKRVPGAFVVASVVSTVVAVGAHSSYDKTDFERPASVAADRFYTSRAVAIGTGAGALALGGLGAWLVVRSRRRST